MNIHELLNYEDGSAEWQFEDSDVDEDDGEGGPAIAEEEESTKSDSEAALVIVPAIPAAQRKLTGNAYVDGITRESGLHIIRDKEVNLAYKERGELGLFSLFFTREFRDSLQTWTNTMLKEKGKDEATALEIYAHIGLEIAMSIVPLTEIKDFCLKSFS
ncbi:Dihydrolipoyllysine-residue succinyltransferase [Phytophthora cinnamomi]|uniref:Dihydrolipoyllysine-residue succinyltransferase n=1 Tax=Phytophthora cinnamomi TaxID=4785 RepID=UPI00355A0229|nr:Dihydrolipoyllysine-residue succinyltransferase [Phytophthora cinnamomi]